MLQREEINILNKKDLNNLRSILKSLIYIILSFLVLTQNATADDKSAAKELLKGKLEAVVMVLQNEKHDQESKKKEVVEIVTPIFDFALMSRLSLGSGCANLKLISRMGL